MKKSAFAILLLTLLFPLASKAEWNDSIRYHGEINMTFSGGDHTPFFQVSNQYGLSSITRNNAYLRLGAFHDMDPDKRFTWGAGVDLAVAARFTSIFVVQQLYAEARYRCLNLMVGSKEIPQYIRQRPGFGKSVAFQQLASHPAGTCRYLRLCSFLGYKGMVFRKRIYSFR